MTVASSGTVDSMELLGKPAAAERLPRRTPLDPESHDWLDALRGRGAARGGHRPPARTASARRPVRGGSPSASASAPARDELDDIALEAANDALMSVLARLDDFRGISRFTTWAYKFALLEAAVRLRKRAWQGREVPLEPETWSLFSSKELGPDAAAEQSELVRMLQRGIEEVLTQHQRRVLLDLALNGVPIDVLAEALGTTRGALYKTLHDARRKLRKHLTESGLALEAWLEEAS
jgi:RNA polymerase sigma-70 factor, ECF subfamily